MVKLLRPAALLAVGRWRAVKPTMAGVSAAVALIGASVALPVAHAAADQIETTRAQLAAMEAKVEVGAADIHRLTLAYDQANVTVATLGQQIGADQKQVSRLRSEVSASESVLRREALLSYTGAASDTLVLTRGAPDPAVGAEYLQVATGDINDNVDQYRTQQQQLGSAQRLLAQQQRAGQVAEQAASAARQHVIAEAEADQAELNQLQQQLNQEIEAAAVVAAQQRAQAAARAAAAAAAAQAARPARQSQPTPTQGLPVNNGLVNVVRAMVSTSAPAPAAPTSSAGGVWQQLRECESSGNYATNTGNGFYGAYQFTLQTWEGLGLSGLPSQASPQAQDAAAARLQAEAGWGQWPACSLALGLR